jgi:hypothetical protein
MVTFWVTGCIKPHCGWVDESESHEAVCAAAKRHEANNAGHETVLHERQERGKKKPYRKPELIEYGNVAQLTAGSNGARLDMHNMSLKTFKSSSS